jgi:chemotaxis protein MotB
MAMSSIRSGWMLAAVVLAATVLGGCDKNRHVEEKDALRGQNNELQRELNDARRALELAENERTANAAELERMRAEVARIQAELEAARRAQATDTFRETTTVIRQDNTGFEGIGGGTTTERTARGITVRVPGDVLFASGKADLTAASRKTLAQIAGVIKKQYGGNRISVEGHTDTDPIRKSKWPSNQALSEARAGAVAAYLEQQGVRGDRMDTVGHGAAQPRGSKAQSRRVEIIVLNAR